MRPSFQLTNVRSACQYLHFPQNFDKGSISIPSSTIIDRNLHRLPKSVARRVQEVLCFFPAEFRPPAEFNANTYYSADKGCHRGRSLAIEMMCPDSIYGNHIATTLDVLGMMDR